MAIHSTAKTRIYIGTTAPKATVATYAADTWTEILALTEIGEFGPEAAEIPVKFVNSGYVGRRKGTIDSGALEVVCARDPLDAGQDKARLAAEDPLPYNIKIVLPDAGSGTGAKATTFYFSAVVLSAKTRFNDADSLTESVFNLGVDGAILEDPATAGT